MFPRFSEVLCQNNNNNTWNVGKPVPFRIFKALKEIYFAEESNWDGLYSTYSENLAKKCLHNLCKNKPHLANPGFCSQVISIVGFNKVKDVIFIE